MAIKQTRSLCSPPKSSESHVGGNGRTKKFLNLDETKTSPEREISLNEMPNELWLYVLEQPEIEKVFNQPSFRENDSLAVCYKLEIKSHFKGFSLFEFWYMKQLPSE